MQNAQDKKLTLKDSPEHVKVWNRNTLPYKEVFRDKLVEIGAGEHIVMHYEEAISFLKRMPPIKLDKNGQIPKEYWKYLQIDPEDKRRVEAYLREESEEKSSKVFVCAKCGDEFDTKKQLMKHVKKNHEDDLADRKTVRQLDDMLEDDND